MVSKRNAFGCAFTCQTNTGTTKNTSQIVLRHAPIISANIQNRPNVPRKIDRWYIDHDARAGGSDRGGTAGLGTMSGLIGIPSILVWAKR
jgi:hypothetical protein